MKSDKSSEVSRLALLMRAYEPWVGFYGLCWYCRQFKTVRIFGDITLCQACAEKCDA